MNTADTLMAESPMELASSNITSFSTISQSQSLRDCVEKSMDNYFRHLDGQPVTDVYDMVLAEVEAPMLEIVMKHTRHNQTKAAQVLGLNRGTLRKKLKQYGLL
ncbi:MAG: DNA-binding transcriptional regulator Fis [Cellvibrionaceae bacterium]